MPEDDITTSSLSSSTNQLAELDPVLADNLIKTNQLEKKIQDLERNIEESKKDYIIFLGLFASLITYLTIEIQILKSATDFSLILGLSTFTLAGLLLFNLCLNYLAKESISYKNFFCNPITTVALLLWICSGICFYFHFKSIQSTEFDWIDFLNKRVDTIRKQIDNSSKNILMK